MFRDLLHQYLVAAALAAALLPIQAGCGQTVDAVDPDAGEAAGDAGPDDTLEPDASEPVAELDEALDCKTKGEAGGLAAGSGLARIDVDLAQYPDAMCNDGTPAVFYVRRHSSEVSRGRWVIYMQGGGSCKSGQSCADRWCSHEGNFGADKMSSTMAPANGMVAKGIQRPTADNPFGDWNQVHVYYCSSDGWSGQARDVVLSGEHPVTGEPIEYRAQFMGSRILDAVIAMLRREQGVLSYSDAIEMPNLDDAELVVLAGSSAGSNGVKNNLDRLAAELVASNSTCAGESCPLQVYGVVDAGFSPTMDTYDLSGSQRFCEDSGLCSYQELMENEVEVRAEIYEARGDDSCETWHAANDPESIWRCADLGHVLRHHVTTPFFVRMDQNDSLHLRNAVDEQLTVPSHGDAVIDADLLAELIGDDLADLDDIQSLAEEGAEIGTVPGYFGPRCGHHESLRSNGPSFDVLIDPGDGTGLNTLQVLARWITGGTPTGLISTAATLTCP